MTTTALALWLLPDEQQSELFSRHIRALCRRYHGPDFQPHVTLLSKLQSTTADVRDLISQLTNIPGIAAMPCGFDCENSYWRFLYVKLEKEIAVMQLRSKAEALFGAEVQAFTPHVSLMYAEPDRRRFESICAELSAELLQPFTLNRLALVALADDPGDWEVVSLFPLRKGTHLEE